MYFGPGLPCGGVDYSRPPICLEPNFLAPGTVNTSQHNGFVCSSPWLAGSPFSTALAANEWVLGIHQFHANTFQGPIDADCSLVVTNIAVYQSSFNIAVQNGAAQLAQSVLTVLHAWNQVTEINLNFIFPGGIVSFVEVNQTVFIAGLMFNGIFQVSYASGHGPPTDLGVFAQTTAYVTAAYIIELAGRLVAAQTRFPTGGGPTGNFVTPTIAWTGVGAFTQWDPAALTGGGFNLLSDVPDSITGLASIGRSAMILRQNGISQQDPNSNFSQSGIQPFVWYHLWASNKGVGALQGTVAQYGDRVFFQSDDNVYSISISGGLAPIGQRYIAKINQDQKKFGFLAGISNAGFDNHGYWYYSSVAEVSGQIHYLTAFTAYTINPASGNATPTFTALVYDFNLSEQAWHTWDMSAYFKTGGGNLPFIGFSCPIVQVREHNYFLFDSFNGTIVMVETNFYLCGGYSTYNRVDGSIHTIAPAGGLFNFVPNDYDFLTNPITSYVALMYPPLALPQSTINFRNESLPLGHKITTRSVRMQAANAPLPTVVAGAQQRATVQALGSVSASQIVEAGTRRAPNLGPNIIPFGMQGNAAPTGNFTLQTYYGDAVLTDEMVSIVLSGKINDAANPWQSLPALRLAAVSLIANDPEGSKA